MENETRQNEKPKYASDGVAVWEAVDKNNNPYLYIKVVGHNPIRAFYNKDLIKKVEKDIGGLDYDKGD